jgi:conserved repeat domain
MNLRRVLFVLIVLTIVFSSVQFFLRHTNAQAGPAPPLFYDLDVVAVNGQNGLTGLFAAPSINDKGVVAMSGRTTGGAILISDLVGSSHNIIPNLANPTRFFSGPVQIDNNNNVLSQEFVSGTSPAINFLRRSDGNGINLSTVIYGANGTGLNDFDAISPNPSTNNVNQVAFNATIGSSTTNLITGVTRPAFNRAQLANSGASLRPMIADDGRVVVQAGGATTDPILLYENNLASSNGIASSVNGFTAMGQSPGISDDGKIVAFYGNITISGITGPGIFASLLEGSTRRTIRLTGRPSELGTDSAGNPLLFSSVGYVPSSRVGVIHQEFGPDGLDGDSFIACFMGTPTAISPDGMFNANLGLWTVRTDIKFQDGAWTYRTFSAMPVAQLFDTVSNFQITGISIYDPIAKAATETINGAVRTERRGENRVTFFATTNSGNIIVRGSYLDSDEDTLPDGWETNGVKIGGVFIDLPAMGANPRHKDLFVHADWMAANGGVTFKPKASALSKVIAVFRAAPVSNPDGASGINIHIDAGPDSVMNPATGRHWNSFSRAGEVPFQFSILPNLGGDVYQWSDVDSIKANRFTNNRRGPVFHYALFANRFNFVSGAQPRSGLSRTTPGADFVVTLGPAVVGGGTTQQQTGTFIHELGHNLGLKHGGDQDIPERKPNYLSLMNYRFQFEGLILANKKRKFDYSTNALASLDEASLNETIGIGDPENRRTIWGPIGAPCQTNLALPAIDWNCSGLLDLVNVPAEINGDTVTSTGATPMHGFNDWPAVVLDGGGKIGTGASRGDSLNSDSSPTEPSIDELLIAPADILQDDLCDIEENVVVTPSEGGPAPLEVIFDATAAVAPCGDILTYEWNFGDGSVGVEEQRPQGRQTIMPPIQDNTSPVVTHVYTEPGTYIATVNIRDSEGYTNLVEIEYVIPVTTTTPPQANMAITKTALANPVVSGTSLTYTLGVSNSGPDAAIGVVVSDPLPPGVTFVSASTTRGSCDGSSTVNCSLGTMANGASATISIVVTPNTPGVVINSASVESNLVDPTPVNNSATTTTIVLAPSPRLSPLGKIAFATNRDGNYELYLMNQDGSGQTNVTNNAAHDCNPNWSPDGSKITFQSDRDGNLEIYVINTDGSNPTRLTTDLSSDYAPTWSPDGSKIAFQSFRDGTSQIYVMNSDGTNQTRLTNHAGYDYFPIWSPLGNKIGFSSTRDGNLEIYVMNTDGSEQTRITNNSSVDHFAAWSPDGSKFAFITDRDGNYEVYVMNVDGTNQVNLSNNSATEFYPVWAPLGDKILFSSYRDGNSEIYSMNPDGSSQTRLTSNTAGDFYPAQ